MPTFVPALVYTLNSIPAHVDWTTCTHLEVEGSVRNCGVCAGVLLFCRGGGRAGKGRVEAETYCDGGDVELEGPNKFKMKQGVDGLTWMKVYVACWKEINVFLCLLSFVRE